jgi:glycosyltransferase involved in cell wall biosynthesis
VISTCTPTPSGSGLARRDNPKPKLLLTLYAPAWLDHDLGAGLTEHFDVRLRTVLKEERRRTTARVTSKKQLILDEVAFFLRLLVSPSSYDSNLRFVCLGGHYGTLLFGRVLDLLGRQHRIYLLNFYLHELGRNPIVKQLLALLLSDNVRLLAQSTADIQYFERFLPERHIVRVPYCQAPWREIPFSEAEPGLYVFSGGATNRDYDALLRCARRLPQVNFIIAASVHSRISEQVPDNVRIINDCDPVNFHHLMAKSRFVVIPLKHDVGSSGQMVLLAAMQFGKATVVSRVGAVADYIDDGKTGIFYSPGDDDSLGTAIMQLYADEQRTLEIGAAARHEYLANFTPARFNREVVEYVTDDGDVRT